MLKKIFIENFGGVKTADLDITRNIVLFLGENGQGKTSIKNALVWAITGSLPGLKKKDEGFLVRQGTKKATVRVQVGDKSTERTRTKTTVNGDFLIKKNFVSICQLLWSSPWKIFNWFQSKDGQKWLAQRLNKGPTVAEVEKYTGSSLPPSIRIAFQQGGLEAAYNEAVSKRREAKRSLAELEKIIPPEKVNLVENMEGLQETLQELQRKKDAQTKIKYLRDELKYLRKEENRILQNLKDIKETVFICPELNFQCPVEEIQDLFSKKEEKKILEEQLQSLRQQRIKLEAEVEEIEKMKIPEDINIKIEDIQQKIAKFSAYQAEKARWGKIQQQKKSLEQEIKNYDALVKKLNPAEAGKVLSKGDGLEKLNEKLARWVQFMGFQIKFNDQFELEVVDGRPIIGLSFSEIYRAGVALAIALAGFCNIKILMFDVAEVLVQGTQINFVRWMKTLEADGYQILIFAASKEKPKANPAFQVIHVKAGVVK